MLRFLSCTSLAAASCLLLAYGSPASARAGKAAPSPQAAAFHVVIGELKAAHQLLNNANHDYDGHRGRASHEVHVAIKTLHKGHKGSTNGTHNPKYKIPAHHEGQALSDAQIAQAQKILQQVASNLATLPNNSQVNQAGTQIVAAINEINLALAYSAQHLRK